ASSKAELPSGNVASGFHAGGAALALALAFGAPASDVCFEHAIRDKTPRTRRRRNIPVSLSPQVSADKPSWAQVQEWTVAGIDKIPMGIHGISRWCDREGPLSVRAATCVDQGLPCDQAQGRHAHCSAVATRLAPSRPFGAKEATMRSLLLFTVLLPASLACAS